MADPIGALGTLFSVVVSLHDGIGSHRVGKADISFQLVRYQTYLRRGERQLIERGIRSPLCAASAVRLTELHSGVAEWLVANKFKKLMSGKTKLPFWFLSKKADSLKGHVEAVKEARERLWDELQGEVGCMILWAYPLGGLVLNESWIGQLHCRSRSDLSWTSASSSGPKSCG